MNAFNHLILVPAIVYMITGCSGNPANKSKNSDNLQNIEWKVIGPGGGGGVMRPTVSPFNENFVMTNCDMTAAYVSHNGGETWKIKNLYNVPEDFEFDPVDSNILYVATRGFLHSEDRGSGISMLLRSDDMGEKWQIIYPDVSKAKKVERLQSTKLLPSELIDGAFNGTIQKIEVDPSDNNRIYAGMVPLISYMASDSKDSDSGTPTLLLSTDYGNSWKTVASLPDKRVMAIFPQSNEGYVAVFSEDNCVHINEATGKADFFPLPAEGVTAIEGGRYKSGYRIYLQARFNKDGEGGMFISHDLGRTWEEANNGLTPDNEKENLPVFLQGLAVCETNADVAYISFNMPRHNARGTYDPLYCVYKTSDGGMHWGSVLISSSFEGYLSKNYEGSWMEESFDPGWGGSPINLGVAPGNPDICYAGDNGRGYKTIDGGKTWIQIYSRNNPDGSYSSNGLDVTTCYGVHFDPYDRNHFFICYTDIGLFHTFNGGESWFHSIAGIPRNWQNTCYGIVFDPTEKGKLWSVWANAHDLPRAKMFSERGFGNFKGGVAVSEDAGLTWNKSNTGIPENSICTSIHIDVSPEEKSKTMYVTVFDGGIYKSADGGKTWNISNKGLGNNLFAWQIRQNSKGRLFVVFPRGESHGAVVNGSVYFSDDQAETWNNLTLPEGVTGPHDLLIDTKDPEIMYISCWPRNVNGNDVKGGVIKSTDGGSTWKQVFDERVRVNSAGMDPNDTNIIYINTFQNSAYRSEDSGSTWNRIEGYRFKWGQRVIPDIHHPDMLYLTTYGGSVFYGPAKGIPGIQDDITNMPEGWW